MRISCASSPPPPKANLVTHALHTLYKAISFHPIHPSLRLLRADPCTMTATSLLLFVSLGSVDRCDTELSLSPGGVYHRRSSYSDSTASSSRAKERAAGKAPQLPEQQITMFYNGQIWVCDVTEIQARAIISSAKREMEDVEAQKQSSRRQGSSFPRPDATPSAPTRPPPPLNRSLSMKRSLQRFLQNRKTRAVESSPYGHHRETAI